jgi:hypothetical protein
LSFFFSVLACGSLDSGALKRSDDPDNNTLTEVETKIESVEEAEQRTLQDLFDSLGIDADLRTYLTLFSIGIPMHDSRSLEVAL